MLIDKTWEICKNTQAGPSESFQMFHYKNWTYAVISVEIHIKMLNFYISDTTSGSVINYQVLPPSGLY